MFKRSIGLIALMAYFFLGSGSEMLAQSLKKKPKSFKSIETHSSTPASMKKEDRKIEAFLEAVMNAKTIKEIDKAFRRAHFSASQRKEVDKILKIQLYSKKIKFLKKKEHIKKATKSSMEQEDLNLKSMQGAPRLTKTNYEKKIIPSTIVKSKKVRQGYDYRDKLILEKSMRDFTSIKNKALIEAANIKQKIKIVSKLVRSCRGASQRNKASVVKAVQDMGLNVTDVTEKPDGKFIVRIAEALPSVRKVSKKVTDKPISTLNKVSKNAPSGGTVLRISPSEYAILFENKCLYFNTDIVDVSRDLGAVPVGEKHPEFLDVGCDNRSNCDCPLRDSSFILEVARDKYKQIKRTQTSVEQTRGELRTHCSGPDACPPNKDEKARLIESFNKISERTDALRLQFERLNKRIKLDIEFFENRCEVGAQ